MVDQNYLKGKTGLPVPSSESGLDVDVNYYGLHGFGLRTLSDTPQQLQNVPCSAVNVQNDGDNAGSIYVGGIGDAAANKDKDYRIYPGGDHTFVVNNANLLTVIGDNDNDLVRYHVYRNTIQEPSSVDYSTPTLHDVTPPTVSSTTPIDDATNVAVNTDIFAIFSEDIAESSVTETSVTISPAVTHTVLRDPANHAKVILRPTVNLSTSTGYTVTFTTELTDEAGNALASNFVLTFTTAAAPDTTPPTVSSTFPANAATNVPLDTEIYAIFSEDILEASVTSTSVTISPAVTKTVSRDTENFRKIKLVPSALLASNTVYTITWKTELEDLAGNNLAGDHSISFTTVQVDTTPPTIVSTNPADTGSNVELSANITVTFSETILGSSVSSSTFILKKVSNSEVLAATVTLGGDGLTVTVDPTSNFDYSTQYSLTVKGGTTGVQDLVGNDFAADQTITFTTRARVETLIYNVSDGGTGETTQMGFAYQAYVGTKIVNTNHPLYNHSVNVLKWSAKKEGSPPGNIELWVLNTDLTEQLQIGSGILANSLGTSKTEITFTDHINTHKMQVGEFLVVKYSSGGDTNRIREYHKQADVQPNAYYTEIQDIGDSTDDPNTGWEFAARIWESS